MVLKEEQLVFDFEFGCAGIETEYYRDGAQDLIRRLVPFELLEEKGRRLPEERARFADMLPMIAWSDLAKAPCTLSVLLLCKYRFNACNFFYDMVSRWLLPQKRLNVELFFASDVRLPHLSEDLLSVAEIVIHLKSAQDVEAVRRNLHAIETEIRLGVVSTYHARRILEFKGLSSDGKTAMIQEKIGSLIQSHSKDFDRGIFAQMQQFLVTCPEEFKNERDYHHISRIISNLHSVRTLLKQNVEMLRTKRHIHLKFLKTQLALHKSKHVLGVLVGLNLLDEHEVFEMTHLVSAIQKRLPHVMPVDGSFFMDRATDATQPILYLEIEKANGEEFVLDEIQLLRNGLPDQIKSHIEQLTRPIFMPRNEEEVLRNIMALSRQLRYVNDRPQVTISFDEQKGGELSFTVILLRLTGDNASSVQSLFSAASTPLQFMPDRVRRVGHIRKKYVKEATVFRVSLSTSSFLRLDHSVDLYRARQTVFAELCKILGDLRDFNGGMIYKQNEMLEALKTSLGKTALQHNNLLEQFYHALNPIELRTGLEIEPLKQFFLLFLQSLRTDTLLQKKNTDFFYKQDAQRSYFVVPASLRQKQQLTQKVQALNLPVHQLVSFTVEIEGVFYMGYLLLSEDKELQKRFLETLDMHL